MTAEYPERPVPAVGALVLRDGAILLVKRGRPPKAGHWSVPGGSIEEGETAEAAVVREVLEESGIQVRPIKVVAITDLIERDAAGRVQYDYAIADFLCEPLAGEPTPATDAADARWIAIRDLHEYDLTPTTMRAIEIALRGRPP